MTAVCTQKSSQGCDKKAVVTAACQALRSTGMTVPQGCPVDVTEVKKEQIECNCPLSFCCHNPPGPNQCRTSLVAILPQTQAVRRFIAALHQLHQVTTSYSLPMEQCLILTVTWRGQTVEERGAGQELPLST